MSFMHLEPNPRKKTLVLFKSRHKKIIFHNNFLGEINMTDTFTTPFDGFKWFCMEKFSNYWASKLLT